MLERLAALSLLAFTVLIEPLQAVAQQAVPEPPQGYYGPGPWHMWNGGYVGHGFLMFPLMLLLLGLGCAAIFVLARWSLGHNPRSMNSWGGSGHRAWGDPSYSALQILNERYARGEIAKEEYAEKKATLLAHG
jgi:uncharacterized membrane protein